MLFQYERHVGVVKMIVNFEKHEFGNPTPLELMTVNSARSAFFITSVFSNVVSLCKSPSLVQLD